VKGFGGIGGFLRYRIELDDIIGDATGNYDDDFDPEEDFIWATAVQDLRGEVSPFITIARALIVDRSRK